jgi:hypothetical protein
MKLDVDRFRPLITLIACVANCLLVQHAETKNYEGAEVRAPQGIVSDCLVFLTKQWQQPLKYEESHNVPTLPFGRHAVALISFQNASVLYDIVCNYGYAAISQLNAQGKQTKL